MSNAPPRPTADAADVVEIALAVLHTIPDAVIYADRDGLIRFWNAGAERIFGFLKGEAVGRSLDIIIPERLRERHRAGFRTMMETGRSRHRPEAILSVPALTKAGDTLSIQFTVTPVLGQEGTVIGIAAVLRDVTATFDELKRLRAEATRAWP